MKLAHVLAMLAIAMPVRAQVKEATAEQLFREARMAMTATCHEKQGKVASAWLEYTKLAELAQSANDSARATFAAKHAAALEPVPTLVVHAPAGGTLRDVKVDGQCIHVQP